MRFTFSKTKYIKILFGSIKNISIQVSIIPFKPDWIGGEPAANRGVVPAVDVVLQSGIGVEGFTGVTEKERVCAGGEVAEGVVDEVSG